MLRCVRSLGVVLSLCASLSAWSGLAIADPTAVAPATQAPAPATQAPAPATQAQPGGDAFVLLAPASEFERCEPAPQEASPTPPQGVASVAEAEASKAASAPAPAESVAVPPMAPTAPDTASTYWTTERVVGWSLLGSAAAASVVAIYFYDQQRDADERYQELHGGAPTANMGEQLADAADEYQRARSVSLVAASMAIGFAATGTTLLILGNSEASGPGAAPELVLDPTSARIGFSGRF